MDRQGSKVSEFLLETWPTNSNKIDAFNFGKKLISKDSITSNRSFMEVLTVKGSEIMMYSLSRSWGSPEKAC